MWAINMENGGFQASSVQGCTQTTGCPSTSSYRALCWILHLSSIRCDVRGTKEGLKKGTSQRRKTGKEEYQTAPKQGLVGVRQLWWRKKCRLHKWTGRIYKQRQACVAMRLTARHELYSAGRSSTLTGVQKYQINRDEIWSDGQSCFLHWRMHTGSEFALQDLFTQKPEETSMARRTLWSTEGLKLATNLDARVRLSQRALWYWHSAVQTAWVPIGTHWGIFEICTVEWQCLAAIGLSGSVIETASADSVQVCQDIAESNIREVKCDDVRWLWRNWPGTAHSCGWWHQKRPCTSGHLTLRANDRIAIQADDIPQHNLNWHNFVSHVMVKDALSCQQ